MRFPAGEKDTAQPRAKAAGAKQIRLNIHLGSRGAEDRRAQRTDPALVSIDSGSLPRLQSPNESSQFELPQQEQVSHPIFHDCEGSGERKEPSQEARVSQDETHLEAVRGTIRIS